MEKTTNAVKCYQKYNNGANPADNGFSYCIEYRRGMYLYASSHQEATAFIKEQRIISLAVWLFAPMLFLAAVIGLTLWIVDVTGKTIFLTLLAISILYVGIMYICSRMSKKYQKIYRGKIVVYHDC